MSRALIEVRLTVQVIDILAGRPGRGTGIRRSSPHWTTARVPERPVGERGWVLQAACREEDPELFYDATEPGIAAAKAVCRHCPVWRECLDDAGDDPWAVWGGLSARDRRRRRTS